MGQYVIFGGSGGIGREVCLALLAQGHRVLAAARSQARLDALDHAAAFDTLQTTVADAANPADVARVFEALPEPPAGVANLAGAFLLKPAHLTSDDEFALQLTQNLTTAFNVLRAAVRAMTNSGGSVVLVSSVAARLGLANHEAVAAAKAGVEGLVRAAAASYAPRNIRVNAVAPGLTKTPLTERITASEPALKASAAMHPLGRIGEPRDVALAVAYLLAPAAAWISGQVLSVDGGLSTVRAR
ncbi:MAG: SDR family oxidoreductase [Phycisphaeraceae bacterium]|nr:MAG: SDR family oxidoreductase [Phycisphaeraceae bacterium]